MNCYLLIDANNFMFRCKLGHKLTHDIKRVEVIYSGFRNLIGLINKVANDNKDCSQVITAFCWDGGYTRRMEASIKSKEKGLIDLLYKEKRRIMRDAKKEVQKQEV